MHLSFYIRNLRHCPQMTIRTGIQLFPDPRHEAARPSQSTPRTPSLANPSIVVIKIHPCLGVQERHICAILYTQIGQLNLVIGAEHAVSWPCSIGLIHCESAIAAGVPEVVAGTYLYTIAEALYNR